VLAHVRGEELVVGETVERSHDGGDAQAEPRGEERDSVPAGEIRTVAAAEPGHRLEEEDGGDRGGDYRNHADDCASDRRESALERELAQM